MYVIESDTLGVKVEIELGDQSPGDVDNADGSVTLEDGSKWAFTLLTYQELGRLLLRRRYTGENLDGKYFTCPDLLLMSNPGALEAFAAVCDLVKRGAHSSVFTRVEEVEAD